MSGKHTLILSSRRRRIGHRLLQIVSAQALLDEDIWDMWYVGHRLPTEFISMGAVVTASGTGAEQNNGAVITHEEKKLKQPLFGAFHSFAVLDSDLTKTVPMKQESAVHSIPFALY